MATEDSGARLVPDDGVLAETPRGNEVWWASDYADDQRLIAIQSDGVGSVVVAVDRNASAYDVSRLLFDLEDELATAIGEGDLL